uniref:DUF7812 domain-containing protein n=1 Tax=Leersia perrieri TaxID=77586 RepID=A0A0D9VFQ7_9ORYZ
MADADELEGAAQLSSLAFHELSSAAAGPDVNLAPLLRFCLLTLPRSADTELAFRRCTRLLATLRWILSRDPAPSLLPALEVFFKNIVSSNRLMNCFTAANAAMLQRSRTTPVGSCYGWEFFVMELMSHHFISSVQDEEGFLSALSWSVKDKLEIPEIGLSGALSLLHRSSLFSWPAAFHAHFLLLACRCVGDGYLKVHLLAFQHAMNVYLSCLPALGVFRRISGEENPSSSFIKGIPLDSCIQDESYQKLTCDINRLVLFCKLRFNHNLPINRSDMFDFIEENQQVLHEQFREDIVTALKRIVSNALVLAKQEEMDNLDLSVTEEIICLTAALRLMSSSFLQIMYGIRQMTVADASQTTIYLEQCKLYNFISEIICLLGHYEASELHKYDFVDTIGRLVDGEQDAMLIVGFGFMWKGCIFMMMMAMNLCGNKRHGAVLFDLIHGPEKSEACSASHDGTSKGVVLRKSSTAIALQFKNIQKTYTQDKLGHEYGEGCSSDILRKCTSSDQRGQLQTFLEFSGCWNSSSDCSDLADFIECTPGFFAICFTLHLFFFSENKTDMASWPHGPHPRFLIREPSRFEQGRRVNMTKRAQAEAVSPCAMCISV